MTFNDPLFDVSDKSIVVVGACGGLGRAMTRSLAERGARLMLGDLDGDAAREMAKEHAAGWATVDITDEADTAALMRTAVERNGDIDALVNASGVFAIGYMV